MIRFFTSPSDVFDGMIHLTDEDAAHIRSLRLRPSEEFIICDGEGIDYTCRLAERELVPGSFKDGRESSGAAPFARILGKNPSLGEPSVRNDLYIALQKGDRLEYAVQKSVELGVFKIILFKSERCVASGDNIAKKITRLQRIALETAKQSGRGIVPEITAALSFMSAVESASSAGLRLFCYEDEKKHGLKETLESYKGNGTISVITGPEGGFTPEEAAAAKDAGILSISLGPRILRSETAPPAVLTAIMYHFGELGFK